jgi:hypothetical protein
MFYYPNRVQAIKIQKTLETLYRGLGHESLIQAASALRRASETKSVAAMILVATTQAELSLDISQAFPDITIIDSPSKEISRVLSQLKANSAKSVAHGR